MNENLEYFNLDANATEEQLKASYFKKRQEIEENINDDLEHDEKIKEVEKRFKDAKEELKLIIETKLEDDVYYRVRRELKEHNFSEAQTILDKIDERDAEWHYHQAMIYYEQGWTNEAKKKLEYTISLDDKNEKYKKAYDNLIAKEKFSSPFESEKERTTKTMRTYSPETEQERAKRRDTGCCVCQSLLCADCCCECFGGDLIPCC